MPPQSHPFLSGAFFGARRDPQSHGNFFDPTSRGTGLETVNTLVGIGASAGGLEALQKLVASLKPEWPLSYVVAQHLSPNHTSMLRELLARETPLLVGEMADGQMPVPGTIYIIPPNTDAELAEGRLRLFTPENAVGPKPSVDRFFSSLATQLGVRAIGIILSGTGGDGAKGLTNIKSAGGIAIVQDPSSAKYSGMPNAALQDARVDYVVAPEEIGNVLEAYVSGDMYEQAEIPPGADNDLQRVVRVVYDQTGLDLSGYKVSTMMRRMHRRMNAVKIETVAGYADYLQGNTDESARFAREVLISVTDFFRDPVAFNVLGELLPSLLEPMDENREVRIWNPGCATGEETYSLAILLEEAIRKVGRPIRYKIFATDIDVHAVAVGRQGSYHASACEALPETLRQRYFDEDGSRWVASKALRNNIVFSVHNLIQDPPFSRVDVISCRNLLIYFNNSLQKRVLGLFNYALNPHGVLFLGRSESIELHKDLFLNVNMEARIFRKQPLLGFSAPIALGFDAYNRPFDKLPGRGKHGQPPLPMPLKINQFAVSQYAPPAVAISQSDDIVYILGDAEPFLTIRSGPTAFNVFALIKDEYRTELRALVYKCRREHKPVLGSRHALEGKGAGAVRIAVRPLPKDKDNDQGDVLMIAFEPVDSIPVQGKRGRSGRISQQADPDRLLELERELTATQEHLRTVIEELETSNEELQSLTEELQSANEELQSTNEELQTSNEELQSTNEELLTVNDEMEVKSRELETTLADLQNILGSTEYPLLVVDKHLRITRYVPAVEQLIERDSVHHGDVVTAVAWKLEINDLRGLLRQVVETGRSHQEILQCGQRYYRFQVKPYHAGDRQIAGAVLWFPEVTDVVTSQLQAAASESRLRSVFASVLVGIITIDRFGVIQGMNEAAERMFGYGPGELTGQRVEKLMHGDIAASHQSNIERYLLTGERKIMGRVRETEAVRKDGSRFPIELAVNELSIGGEPLFSAVINDISRRREVESQLAEQQLRALVTLESINDAVICVDDHWRVQYLNPVAEELTGWSMEAAVNKSVQEVYQIFDEQSHGPLGERLLDQLRTRERQTFHDGILLRHSHGEEFSIEQSVAPLLDKNGVALGAVLSFHDITNRRLLLQQMTWQAQHDPLTGLVNRHEFEHRIHTALASASGFDRQHALLYLDLDQFKLVNDTCGHHAGDELLRQLASLLGGLLRHRDTLARMGGDEFAVLLENCSLTQAEQIADKLHEMVQEFRFGYDEKVFKIGVSIGVVPITSGTKDLATLLSDADAACYAAKESGRNRVQVHSPDDKELEYKRREMHWVSRINLAIDDNRFRLYFQSIFPLKGQEIGRWEVLLRLVDERDDLVPPGVFLPAAERYGLIQSLDRWVLARIVHELAKCPAASRPVVSVNLSGSSIVNPRFFNYAVELMKQNREVAERICFEITETTAITNFSAAQEFMRTMKKFGCLFALDDFGTGMSSFGYLKNLPVDFLKIDGVFVKDILHDQIDLFMVESINRIGQLMNIRTIAEFAESDAIIEKLTQIGVDYAQGFGVGHPVALEQFLTESGAVGRPRRPTAK
ncbi:MAG: EAL domain-containing protein [Methylococcaceae bacterium]|nr:EAL domain-containing protein [Methylococcaceae bacterium]